MQAELRSLLLTEEDELRCVSSADSSPPDWGLSLRSVAGGASSRVLHGLESTSHKSSP